MSEKCVGRPVDARASRGEARTPASPDPTTTPATTPAATTPPAAAPAPVTTTATRPKTVTAAPAPVAPAAGCSAYSGNRLVACNLLGSFGFSTGEMAAL